MEGTVALPKARLAPVASRRYQTVTGQNVLALDPPQAVVYLEGSFPTPANPPKAEMPQKNIAFVNALLPVQVGTRVEFPNQDDTYHNIFSFSKPKRFDLGRYRAEDRPIPSVVFDQSGLVALHCDIHEQMRAIVLVLATPYFVKSDTAGHYRLTGLPAGHFTLKAWIDSKTTLEHPIDLKGNGTLHLDFP